jgi:hypothetical protein
MSDYWLDRNYYDKYRYPLVAPKPNIWTSPNTHTLPDWPLPPIVHLEPAKEKSDGSSTDYYKIPEGSTDLIDLIEYKNMNFAIGNIFKACFRLGEKADTDRAYDLRKIIFFAERELKRITNGLD